VTLKSTRCYADRARRTSAKRLERVPFGSLGSTPPQQRRHLATCIIESMSPEFTAKAFIKEKCPSIFPQLIELFQIKHPKTATSR